MHFHSQSTPEALLPRSDSKNPATTCKGITSNGRPCRRSLAQSHRASPAASPGRGPGVLAVVQNLGSEQSDGAAAFFCWQHKDQAHALQGTADGDTEIVHLPTRTSTDSLIARLGVVTIDEDEEDDDGVVPEQRRRHQGGSRPVRRDTLPQTWQNVPGPLMPVTHDEKPSRHERANDRPPPHRRRRRRRGDLHVSFFCCMSSRSDVDSDPPIAPRPVSAGTKPPPTVRPPPKPAPPIPSSTPHKRTSTASLPPSTPAVSPPAHPSPSSVGAPSAYTQALLSFIPASTSPGTTQLLLAELSKPLTPADRAPGYIYIFWLTPASSGLPPPPAADASTLLAPPSSSRAADERRASAILRTYSVRAASSSPAGSSATPRRLMLKIGRASNVTRRMTEWARQCGHHITLLRYYPSASHAGNSPSPSPPRRASAVEVPQVPLVARVERLIHVALHAQRVRRACDGCGRTHREWFEVDATREGVRRVDATVKRWVEWGVEEGRGL